MIRYQSSYRAVSTDDALARAVVAAERLGISRVTAITHLDRLNIPVFSSIRPGAAEGSLCVNAGKGLSVDEARVGAYMEAIEFACAEPGAAGIKVRVATASDVLDGDARRDAILDLCPIAGITIPLNAKLDCVVAETLQGCQTLVPAELVFYPYPLPQTQTFFGACTNGLASGSTLIEATVHGLLEVIERDIASFSQCGRASLSVAAESMPDKHQKICARLSKRGFDLAVRWLPNEYELACFHAVLWERDVLDPMYVSEGYGCHLDPEVALTRAITEAAQSRLTYIHGARDDIAVRHAQFDGWSVARKRSYARSLVARARQGRRSFDFRKAVNAAVGCETLEDALKRLRDALEIVGMKHVLRVRLTPKDWRVQVVRVIVPLMEYFTPALPRVGRRLARFASDA